VKYCQACGQPNQDDARFCESCGAATGGAVTPATSQPTSPAINTAAMASAVPSALKNNKAIVIGVVAVVVLIILWAVFLKPMNSSEYGSKADKYTADLQDAYVAIGDEIRNYSSDDPTLKVTESEWKASAESIQREEKKIKAADNALRALRPPSELKIADERIRGWADFYAKEYVPALNQAMKNVQGGMTYERTVRQLDEYKFLTKEQQRAMGRGWSELSRTTKDVDLSITSQGE
jgi:hypothetical protein